jgi:hypothetical protein
MQRILFGIIILLCTNLSAQNYLNPTARWVQTFSYSGFTTNTTCRSTLYFLGDTTVNSLLYYKLFDNSECLVTTTQFDSLGEPFQVVDTNISTLFRGFIREESRKVYLLDINGNESMRYNFGYPNFTSVDLVAPYGTCQPANSVSITTHDTVCIGNIGRKRWMVSMSQYPLAQYIIEGVGPSSGFLAPTCRNGCPECGYSLLNFVLNGDTLYQGSCEIPLLVNQPKAEPSISQSETLFSVKADGLENLEVFSINGSLIAHFNSNTNEQIDIPLSNFSPGIYVYRGSIEGVPIHGKFVKYAHR